MGCEALKKVGGEGKLVCNVEWRQLGALDREAAVKHLKVWNSIV